MLFLGYATAVAFIKPIHRSIFKIVILTNSFSIVFYHCF